MNPILLRYGAFLLAAVIAGAGGGYLAVNNKKASPPAVTQSGTIPAIPAQPFPGQGVPAIPAIPAVPVDHPTPPRADAPVLESLSLSKCSAYRATPADAYCLVPIYGYGDRDSLYTKTGVTATGYNFTRFNNALLWDKVVIDRLVSEDNGTKLSFITPDSQQACSLHDVAVKTAFGTSNNLQVKLIDPYTHFLPLWFLGTDKKSSSVGTEVDFRLDIPEDPMFYTLELYAQFSKYAPDKSFMWSGEAVTPLTLVSWPSGFGLGGSAVYRLKIPQEVNQCPTSLYPSCVNSSKADKMATLTPGDYGLQILVVAKGKCSTNVSKAVGFPPFTITEK